MGDNNVLFIIGFWVLAQAVPLLVVWITYKITPNQKLMASGPLAHLNTKMVGAFAGWMIVVTAFYSQNDKIFDFLFDLERHENGEIEKHAKEEWWIQADIELRDKNGVLITDQTIIEEALKVYLNPEQYNVQSGVFTLEKVHGSDVRPEISSLLIEHGGGNFGAIAQDTIFIPDEWFELDENQKTKAENMGLIRTTADGIKILKLQHPFRLRELPNENTSEQGMFTVKYDEERAVGQDQLDLFIPTESPEEETIDDLAEENDS